MSWASDKAAAIYQAWVTADHDQGPSTWASIERAVRETIEKSASVVAPADNAGETSKIVLSIAQQSILALLKEGK